MKKFFIPLAASVNCFACKSGTGDADSSETSSDLSVETPAKLVAERVPIGDLYYNLYDNNTAEVVSEFSDYPYNDDHLRGEVIIPSSVQVESATYTVTSIGAVAFYGCTSLTSVTIPNSVTSIEEGAFDESGITEPVYNVHVFAYLPRSYSGHYSIPQGIEQIAGGAFAYCRSLTSVTIPNSVTSIGEGAFDGCENLTSVTIPNSVTSIGNYAFYGCTSLTSVTIPNSVTSIGEGAFDGSGITRPIYIDNVFVYLPESYSGHYSIPQGIEQIAEGAFKYCRGLTSVTIPNSVTNIGNWAFYDCESLISVAIPNSVITIGDWAFDGCKRLTSVTIPNSVTSIGYEAFCACKSLTSVTIPNSVTSIGGYAFANCESLTSVTIPKHAHVAENAFEGCSPNLQIKYEE